MLLYNSLPELGDGGGEVGGVGSQPEGFVLAVGVLDAAIGVPGLFALSPGQLRLKTLKCKTGRIYSGVLGISNMLASDRLVDVLITSVNS